MLSVDFHFRPDEGGVSGVKLHNDRYMLTGVAYGADAAHGAVVFAHDGTVVGTDDGTVIGTYGAVVCADYG